MEAAITQSMTTNKATVTPIRSRGAKKSSSNSTTASRSARSVKSPLNKLSKEQRKRLTWGAAALTPFMSGVFAHAGAESFVTGGAVHYGLGAAFATVAVSVLYVSLPHVAAGLREITRQPERNCLALAIGIDAGLLVCKAGLVLGVSEVTSWILWGALTILLVASFLGNLVAYSVTDVTE